MFCWMSGVPSSKLLCGKASVTHFIRFRWRKESMEEGSKEIVELLRT